MIDSIKKDLMEKFNVNKVNLIEINVDSKNLLYKVLIADKKYLLKIFKEKSGYVDEHKEHFVGFENELNFLLNLKDKFSFIPKIYFYQKEDEFAWFLLDFFDGIQASTFSDLEFEDYQKYVDLIISIHNFSFNLEVSEEKIIRPYLHKLEEVEFRIVNYLPEKFDKFYLLDLVRNLKLKLNRILDLHLGLIHGDFNLRNILIDRSKNILLVDFENSRIAPCFEDLVFFLEEANLSNQEKSKLIEYYNKNINYTYSQEDFHFIDLIFQLRIFGSFLRRVSSNIEQYFDKILLSVESIMNKAEMVGLGGNS